MPERVLERFHRALIEEIQTQRPEYLTQPFTVAEIYQNLVPYGSHRDRIGVEMNGDYEDALLRLLAGEGDYLILDSEPALRRLRAELETKSPNTGVYREYAAVDVRLNQAHLDLSQEALDDLNDLAEELEGEDSVAVSELAPAEGSASAPGSSASDGSGDIFSEYVAPDGGVEDPGSTEAAETTESPSGWGDGGNGGSNNGGAPASRRAAPEAPVTPSSLAPKREPLEPEFVVSEDGDEDETGRSEAKPGSAEGICIWCRADLPDRPDVNYCPYCGTDLRLVPCTSCGAEVEPGWMFCTACGTEVDG
ncbi:MAG: zinc ribbon domain-containing protein [Longimicrobiales bacterium]|nr:zinc ribbon domain-containing protein [Longimicrobiales bacterium]